MKKAALMVLLFLAAVIQPRKALATHAAGGEIIYEWIADSTYRFSFTFYRDCSGINEADTTQLCFDNPCNTSADFTINLYKVAGQNGTTQPWCPQYKTQCDSPNSYLKGYRKWVYTGLVTMPARCSAWRISAIVDSRNSSTNLNMNPYYAETMMNNTGSYQGNSSPYFTASPVPIVCLNYPSAYNSGAMDPNGDSLSYQLIMPRTVPTSGSCASTPVNLGFNSSGGGPNYALPFNPFQTNNTFYINQFTGVMGFTPSLQGAGGLAVRIREYRNGVLIGYVDRDVQIQVNPCNQTNISFDVSMPGPIQICAGQQLNLCYTLASANPNSILIGSNDHAITFPGSAFTYQLQTNDSVRGCLSWTPGINDKGMHRLSISLKDSTCEAPGIMPSYYYYLDVLVAAPAFAGKDTAICLGNSIQLDVSGQGIPTWSVIYGTPNSLSCTGCQFPTLSPVVTSAYELILTSGTPCLNSKDTITINIGPYNKPSVSITAAPDTNVASGTLVTFTASPTNCNNPSYKWQRNGIDLPGGTSATYSSSNLNDLDVITVRMQCTDTCIIDTPSNKLKMHIGVGIKDVAVNTISVHPNPNAGEFTITGYTVSKEVNIEVVNITGQVVYAQSKVATTNGQVDHKVSIGNIGNGVYMLRINAGDKVITERFTIQR